MRQIYLLSKGFFPKQVMVAVTLSFVFESVAISVNGQCISSQSSYLVSGCGNTEMVLNASQGGVQYSMINQRTGVKVGGNNGQGNGGSVSVGIATSTDIYFVRAKSEACSDSVDFGHRLITVLPPPIQPQIIGGTFYCNGGGGSPVQLILASSEIGVNYELFYNGNYWAFYSGTGGAIVLGYYNSQGSYMVKASRSGSACSDVESEIHEITGTRSLPIFEGFNTNRLAYEICWDNQYEAGSSDLGFASTSSNPSTAPFEASHFLFWNSANPAFNNTRTRMISTPINTTGINNVEVEFYWFNNNNTSFSTGNYLLEGVQLQYSLDGTNWQNVGALVTRHDNTVSPGTGQWKRKNISLPAAAGNQNTVYIAFSFRGFGGNNCALDAITVKAAGTCTGVFDTKVRDINHNSAKIHYSGSGNYIVEYGPVGFVPGTGATAGSGGTVISTGSSPVSITGLNSSTPYDVYIRQNCGSSQFSQNSQKTQFTTCCAGTQIPYRQNFDDVSAANPTCIRVQDIDNDSYSWSIDASSNYASQPNSLSLAANGFVSYSDDWFFTPGLNLTGGISYRLRFKYRTTGSFQIFQSLQIKLGVAADSTSMNATIFTLNNFAFANYQQADLSFTPAVSGTYYLGFHGFTFFPATGLYIDDISLDVSPPCSSDITNLVSGAVTGTTANLTWNNISSGYQYAITTLQTPPASGTFTNTASVALSGLTGSTKYYFHVRAQCSPGIYGNWFTSTFYTAPDCESAPLIQLDSEVEVLIPAGNGYWNFAGAYPINSLGKSTPGKEKLYRFTVPETGIYYIDIVKFQSSEYADYFLKKKIDGCSNTGWSPIFAYNGYYAGVNSALGLLEPGIEYVILIDGESTNILSHTFKIRKATINPPTLLNEGISFNFYRNIPANSPKIEYVIDYEGNVLASFDFSSTPTPVTNVYVTYSYNSGPIRRDKKIEYLDRNIAFSFYPNTFSVRTRIYFNNTELQKLIAEPDDGIGDVSGISDLRVTQQTGNYNYEPGDNNIVIEPSVSGAIGPSINFLEFTPTDINAGFSIHGGTIPILTDPFSRTACSSASAWFSYFVSDANSYQWQVDSGSGFVNITDNAIYSGSNSFGLLVNNPPLSYGGNKYRCVIVKGPDKYYASLGILRFQNEWYGGYSQDWHDPNNWTCGVVPNEFMDVVISDMGYLSPIINANAVCKSLTIKEGKSVTVNSGFKLEIKGK